jgi:N-methylhydantoinase A
VADGVTRFHDLHARTFGHAAPEVRTELVAARIAAFGLREMPDLPRVLPDVPGAPRTHRPVAFAGSREFLRTAIHEREDLASGQVVEGPAVVEQLDATTLVPPGHAAVVHPSGALVIASGSRA